MDKIMQTIFSFITIIIIGLVLKKKGYITGERYTFYVKNYNEFDFTLCIDKQ